MNTRARMISVALAAAPMVVAYFYFQHHYSSVMARVREAETGVPTWNAGAAKQAVTEANESWEAAMQAVTERNPKQAFVAYHRAVRGEAAYFTKHYPQNEATPGITLRSWFDKRDKVFREAFHPQVEGILDDLARGDRTPGEVKQLVRDFANVDFKEPQQQFKQAEQRIAETRARAATRWLRVVFQQTENAYETTVKEGHSHYASLLQGTETARLSVR